MDEDSAIGGISGALGTSGINKVGSILANRFLEFFGSVSGDLLSSNGDWSQVNLIDAFISGAVGGYLGRSAGAQNTKKVVEDLLKNKNISKTFNTLYNATNKYISGDMSKRGFRGTLNLYSKKFADLLNAELPNVIQNRTISSIKPSKASILFEIISWLI